MVWKNIEYGRFRYALVFLIVLLMNLFLYAGTMLTRSMENGIIVSKNRIGADLMVSGKTENFDTIAEDVMYHGVPSTLRVDSRYEKEIANLPHVTGVTSRLYLATLEGQSCCDDKVQLIATDLSSDFLLSSWVQTKELAENEIILGSKFRADIGDTVTYFGTSFTVKEVLEKTGTGYDLSGFISYESAQNIIHNDRYAEYFSDMRENTTSVLFVNSDNPEVTKDLLESRYPDISVYAVDTKLDDYIKSVAGTKRIMRILDVFLVISDTLAVFGITAIATANRKNEVGTHLLLGHKKQTVVGIFLMEQIVVFLAATVVSVLLYETGVHLFLGYLEQILGCSLILPNFLELSRNSLLLFGFNVIIAIGSVLFSILWLVKRTPAELIKESS